jgi:iron complex outermembrane receptor protein
MSARVSRNICCVLCCGTLSYVTLSADSWGEVDSSSVALPPVTVAAPKRAKKKKQVTARRVAAPVRRPEPAPLPEPVPNRAPAPSTAAIGNLPPEYPGGQVARGGRVGVLGNRDFMDTPFNVTSYTAKTIEDQGARTVADVTINDPSVRSTAPSGGILDSFFIRGFPINEGNFGEIAFDGVFGVAPAFRVFTDYVERIEVIKGPTALLNGIAPNGGVGGTINVVPKRASWVDLTRLTTDYTSNLFGGAHLDLSRRFGADRQFGVRFNGSYHGGDTAIDNQSREFGVGALALDYQGERFRATLDIVGQREEFIAPQRPFFPLAGIAIPAAPNGRSNIQQRWERSKIDDLSWLGRAEYDVTDQVTLFAAAGGGNSRVERLFGTPTILNSAGDVSVRPENFIFDIDRQTAETGVRTRFDTAWISHNMTFQATHFHQSLGRGINSGTLQFTNLYNPVARPAQNIPEPASVPTISTSEFNGLALTDTLSMLDKRVQLIVGGRWQHIESDNFSPTTGAVTSSSNAGTLTPLVGLVVKPWENVSLYANYIEGLGIGDIAPAVAANAGEILPPFKSKQIEVGTKVDLGRIAMTFSVFQIEKPFGQLEPRPGGSPLFVEGGEQRNRGVEFEVFGEMTPGVRLLGGVTFLDGTLTKTTSPTTLGNTPIGVPSVQLNMGAEWDVPYVSGLTLAANVIYTGKQFVDTANLQEIPAWTRLDLGVRYRTTIDGRPVTLRAAVENVFDNGYWAAVASFGTLAQGAPRTAKLSLTTDF